MAASAAVWWTSPSDAARPAEVASGAADGVEEEVVTPGRAASSIPAPEPTPAPAADTTQVSGTSATVQRGDLLEAESYLVLVASFRSAQRANDVADQIMAMGLPAFIRPPGGGVWHQVAMGPYASQEEAAAARAVLERAHFDNSVVVSSTQERTMNTPNQD
jgi:cell division septation protein DedD